MVNCREIIVLERSTWHDVIYKQSSLKKNKIKYPMKIQPDFNQILAAAFGEVLSCCGLSSLLLYAASNHHGHSPTRNVKDSNVGVLKKID